MSGENMENIKTIHKITEEDSNTFLLWSTGHYDGVCSGMMMWQGKFANFETNQIVGELPLRKFNAKRDMSNFTDECERVLEEFDDFKVPCSAIRIDFSKVETYDYEYQHAKRVFRVYLLSEEEEYEERKNQKLFERCVGTHCNFVDNKRLNRGDPGHKYHKYRWLHKIYHKLRNNKLYLIRDRYADGECVGEFTF